MHALLFPGQGSQRPGMGAAWRTHPSWAVVDRLSEATGRDLAGLLVDADAGTLRETRNSQAAVFTLSLVVLDAARGAAPGSAAPTAVAGHSLGEYTALVAAGALSEADGARLVVERGEAMQAAAAAAPGTMAAVLGLDGSAVADACRDVEGVWTANDNAPGQIVVAGTAEGVAAASEAARGLGAKRVMPLAVGGAFHSPLMAGAADRLGRALGAVHFATATPAVVTNVDAAEHTDGFDSLLAEQLVAPVRWRQSLLRMAAMGVTTFVELGPGTELSGMVKRTVADAARVNVAGPDDLAGLAAAIGR